MSDEEGGIGLREEVPRVSVDAATTDALAAPGGAVVRRDGTVLRVSLTGTWSLERPVPRFAESADAAADGEATAVEFDASSLGGWDSSLLTFLMQAMEHCEASGAEFRDEGLPAGIARLLGLVRAVPERVVAADAARAGFAARVGARGVDIFDGAMATIRFTGEVAISLARFVTGRVRLRWRDFWLVVQSNSAGALPIVTLIAFLVGLIIAFLGAVVLRRFGAGYYVSYLVGYGMLREMAALMTGIIMAGRTGAAFAAELGSMKITEEIDAYETLGLSPIDHLVLPRVLGLFLMMPLLTVYAMFVGIAGGLVVAVSLLDLTVTQFMGGLLAPVTLGDALLGVFKGTVFGLIIGTIGCLRGMQTGSDAGAVGRAATSAVVTGITLIIVANAVVDWLAALVGV
jgi:phospholipid/cholesterol/gamma-HCH transport system permease protein